MTRDDADRPTFRDGSTTTAIEQRTTKALRTLGKRHPVAAILAARREYEASEITEIGLLVGMLESQVEHFEFRRAKGLKP